MERRDGVGRTLKDLGFRARPRRGYRKNGLVFTFDGEWPTLELARYTGDLDEELGAPGLWRTVPGNGGPRQGSARRIWQMPPSVTAGDADDGGDGAGTASLLRSALEWGIATADGSLPEGWSPPPREEIEALLPPRGLTVREGAFLSQGELIREPRRLAIAFTVLKDVPRDLPAERRRLLDRLLLDARDRWRLVRLGWKDESAIVTEVDLSGLPRELQEEMVPVSVAALRWVLVWLLPPADFLADPAVDVTGLEGV